MDDLTNNNMVNCKACGKEIAKGVHKCVHCGKDQRNFFIKHKILTGLLIIIVIIIMSSITSKGGSTTGSTAVATGSKAASSVAVPVVKADAVTFSNILVSTTSGITTVNGEAKSNDGQKHTFTLTVSFFDKSKKLLGTAVGTIDDLEPSSSKIFTAMANDDYSKSDSYKVEVDTMVQSGAPDAASLVTFSNLVSKGESGTTLVNGEVKNADKIEHTFTIMVGFYDKAGKLLGVAAGSMDNLASGTTKTYTAMAVGDFSSVASTKVQADAMVQ